MSLGREAKARTRAKEVTLRQFVDFIFNFTDISFFSTIVLNDLYYFFLFAAFFLLYFLLGVFGDRALKFSLTMTNLQLVY